jgi:hypothetical protein
MNKHDIGQQPTAIIVKGTGITGIPNSGSIVKNNKGQLVVTVTAGFKPFWGGNWELLRVVPKSGNVLVRAVESDGTTKTTLLTVAAGTPFMGSAIFNGKEDIFFEATAEFQILVRQIKHRGF